jgi:hypothetical protein
LASTARPRRDGCPAGRPRRPVQLALRSLARTLGATRALLAAASQGTRRSPGSERIGAPGGPGRTRTRSRSLSFEVAGEDPADSAGSEGPRWGGFPCRPPKRLRCPSTPGGAGPRRGAPTNRTERPHAAEAASASFRCGTGPRRAAAVPEGTWWRRRAPHLPLERSARTSRAFAERPLARIAVSPGAASCARAGIGSRRTRRLAGLSRGAPWETGVSLGGDRSRRRPDPHSPGPEPLSGFAGYPPKREPGFRSSCPAWLWQALIETGKLGCSASTARIRVRRPKPDCWTRPPPTAVKTGARRLRGGIRPLEPRSRVSPGT